ncbi:integrase, catalytic region, zinc finger, CCHC-type containing protein [Tanacetum coccineum]
MRVESINGKKYILVIVDDYLRFAWVKFLRSKDEAPEFIIKFLKMIQVRLNTTVRSIRTDNGTEFVNQTLHSYYEDVRISYETSVACTPQKNDVVDRRNRTLVEVARTMLIFSKALLFMWAEAVATACYTCNRSLICLHHSKTPYELLHDIKPYLTYFHAFGALCYPTNDSEDLGKLKPKADIGIFIGYSPAKKAYRIYNRRTRRIMETIHVDFDELTTMAIEQFGSRPEPQLLTPGTISSGLVQKPPSPTPYVLPTKNDWKILIQLFFDEYFNPLPSVASLVPAVAASEPTDPTRTPSSTSIDQDAPSPKSSSRDVITTNVNLVNQPSEHLRKWTKNHPLDNVIGNPSQPVSTRHQLQTKAKFCYFDAFLTFVELNNYKEALKESCWIKAIQEELNEFERLEVWELVPRLDHVMIITLKWIFKVKLDELSGVLKKRIGNIKAEGEIDNLTMKQYLALTRGNQASGMVKPKIVGNHVERILDIVSLFNIPGLTHDAVMLRVFPITLTRATKRYCPPSKTAKPLEEIRNFKQEGDKTLYQAWERNIESSSNTEGIASIVSKLDSLGFFDNERQETDKSENNEALVTLDITPNIKQLPQEEMQSVSYYVEPYEPPILFPIHLEHHTEEALVHKTMESLKKIRINRPLLKEIRQTDDYAKHMKNLVANKPKTEEEDEVRMNPRCSALLQNQLPPKEQDPGNFILPSSIRRLDFNSDLAD